MKILTLCYEYPPLGGGAGRAAKSIAEELAARGHEVRFQTGGMPNLPRLERINGVDVYRTPSFRKREESCSVPEMGLFLLTSFWPTLRHLRVWKPDVIHAHLAVPTGALAYAVHRLTGVPYAITVQLGDVPGGVPDQTDGLYRVLNPLIRPIWKRAAQISAVSEFVRQLALQAYGCPVTRIPNGLKLQGAASGPVTVGAPLRLVSVGRFNPQKNFVFLVEALAQVRELDWQLTMIGDGEEMAAVRAKIAEGGLESRVSLPGWLAAPEVEAILAQADVFLMPSSVEGLSVAALEALKHGLAVVGSDIGGLWDVIEDGVNGFRCPVGDALAFAERLRTLINEPATVARMKAASRGKAREFNSETITALYEALLQRAAATRLSSLP